MREWEYFKKMILYYLKGCDNNYIYFSSIVAESLIESYGKDSLEDYILSSKEFFDDEGRNNIINSIISKLDGNKKSFDYYYRNCLKKLMYLYFVSEDKKVDEVEYIEFLYNAFKGKIHRYKDLKKEIESVFFGVKTSIMLNQAMEYREKRGMR